MRTEQVLDGLDDVPWARMNPAPGPAGEIPDLVRGLLDPDPAVRARALEGLYEAVYDPGVIGDAALAVLPFLVRLVQAPNVPGRDLLLTLIARIGGVEIGDLFAADDEYGADEYDDETLTPQDQARLLIGAGHAVWVALLDDGEPGVRGSAALLLTVDRDRPAGAAAGALGRRFDTEPVAAVRSDLVKALGWLNRSAGVPGLVPSLRRTVAQDPDPSVRLMALAQLARVTGPGPADQLEVDVEVARSLLETAYRRAPARVVTEPAAPETGTWAELRKFLREMRDANQNRLDLDDIVRSVAGAYGDQLGDRTRLLAAGLRSADRQRRLDGVLPTGDLVHGWRGDHSELVRLVGDQLGGDDQLAARAAGTLHAIGRLAAPAADPLHALLLRSPRESSDPRRRPDAWIVPGHDGAPSLGKPMRTLVHLHDPRVLPMLAWILQRPTPPRDAAFAVAGFGAAAAHLEPHLRAWLRKAADGDGTNNVVVLALGAVCGAEALPELLALEPTTYNLAALGDLGPAGSGAVPHLLRHVQDLDDEVALAAVCALRRIRGPEVDGAGGGRGGRLVTGMLNSDKGMVVARGLDVVVELGPAGLPIGPILARLDEIARTAVPPGDRVAAIVQARVRRRAVAARWTLTGEDQPALSATTDMWRQPGHKRRAEILELWERMGPGAGPVEPLLVAELAEPRRTHLRDDETWQPVSTVDEDEALQASIRRILAVFRGGGS